MLIFIFCPQYLKGGIRNESLASCVLIGVGPVWRLGLEGQGDWGKVAWPTLRFLYSSLQLGVQVGVF